MKTRYLVLVLAGVILAGCASTQIMVESKSVPKGASRVVLIRNGSIIGAAQGFKVYDPGKVYDGETLCAEPKTERFADGWLVGKISNGGSLTWHRVPGPMWLTLKISGGPNRQLEELTTEAGKEYTIEFSIGTYKGSTGAEKPKVTVRNL